MNRLPIGAIAIVLGLAMASAYARSQSVSVPANASAGDPYAPLQLYGGSWQLEMTGSKGSSRMLISNHCEETGAFFVCEQVINGKTEDLVVFLPTGSSAGAQTYRTLGLSAAGKRPRDWGKLEISGDHWVYSSEEQEKDAKVYSRTTNLFSGPDKIHFEVQRSVDGKNWQTTQSGDEHRDRK
jgi:hypothetical protein